MALSKSQSGVRRKDGALIEWHDVSYSVVDHATKQRKQILTDMTGMAQPGRLLSIMGPSGAGKSTLLDVLACNAANREAVTEGRICVDGAPRNARAFGRISCYVQQKDVLLSSATVREVILTSALLKLPRSISVAEKRQRVDATLKELDLTACADTLIGDETIGLKGISGGQKRRVSVGIELVKDPVVLFLDEPSSGLDSEMALSVMSSLVRLARRGRTVVCTIHQPNSDITDCFDDFLLLAGGRTMYCGTWAGAVDFFARAGFSCPSFKNPTDYFMSVVTRQEGAIETLAVAAAKARTALLAGMADAAAATAAATAAAVPAVAADAGDAPHRVLQIDAGPEAGKGAEVEEVEHRGVPMWFQVGVLSARYWRTWVRNPIMMWSELVQYVFIAVFVGLMYYKFNDKLGEGDFNRASCIWFAFAILCFTPSYTAVTNWGSERLLLKRELGQRLYGVTSYYLARYSVLLPFEMLQCLLFLAVMYFFAGFHASASGFFTFFAVLSMFQIISEGLGVCCAVATRNSTSAIILLTFLLLFILAFSGFLVFKVPVYFVWVQKGSYLTYAYAALLEQELSHITLVDKETGEVVPGMQAFPSSLHTGLTYAQNIGVLTGMMGFMEFAKLFVFHFAYRFDLM